MSNPFVGVTGGSERNRQAVAHAADRATGLIERSGQNPFEAGVATPNTGLPSGIRGFTFQGAQAYREAVRLRRQFDPGFIAPPLPPIAKDQIAGAAITFEEDIPRMPSFSRERIHPDLREQFDKLTPREKLLLELETPTVVVRMSEQEIQSRAGQQGTLMSTAGGGVVRIQPDDSVKEIIVPPPPDPMTEAGRLRVDLERGSITQEEFDAEMARRAKGRGPLVQIGSPQESAERATEVRDDVVKIMSAYRILSGAPPRSTGSVGRAAEVAGAGTRMFAGRAAGDTIASFIAGGETTPERLRFIRSTVQANLIPTVETFVQENASRLSDQDMAIAMEILGVGGLANDPDQLRTQLLSILRITLTTDAIRADEFGEPQAFPIGEGKTADSIRRLVRLGLNREQAAAVLREMNLELEETRFRAGSREGSAPRSEGSRER